MTDIPSPDETQGLSAVFLLLVVYFAIIAGLLLTAAACHVWGLI